MTSINAPTPLSKTYQKIFTLFGVPFTGFFVPFAIQLMYFGVDLRGV